MWMTALKWRIDMLDDERLMVCGNAKDITKTTPQ